MVICAEIRGLEDQWIILWNDFLNRGFKRAVECASKWWGCTVNIIKIN